MAAVLIVDYDHGWPAVFDLLAGPVAAALGPVLMRVEHVGSTAVPGLAAKPVNDMDAVVRPDGVAAAVRRLAGIGYVHRGDRGVAGREAFSAPPGTPPHHLYVCPADSPALDAHLRLREALREDRGLAGRYGALKRELAARFGADRDGYCEAKTAFIRGILGGQSGHA